MLTRTARAEVPATMYMGRPATRGQEGHVEEAAAHPDEGGDGGDDEAAQQGPEGVEGKFRTVEGEVDFGKAPARHLDALGLVFAGRPALAHVMLFEGQQQPWRPSCWPDPGAWFHRRENPPIMRDRDAEVTDVLAQVDLARGQYRNQVSGQKFRRRPGKAPEAAPSGPCDNR